MNDSEKLDLLLDKVTEMKEALTGVKEDVSTLKEKVDVLEEGLADVKRETARTNMIIDNEIRINIQRVAEGHLDLNRSLQGAMKPSSELEMLSVKVRILESDMKLVKSKVLA